MRVVLPAVRRASAGFLANRTSLLRRILYAIPIGLGVTVICFSLIYIGPSDPIQVVMPDEASEADVQRIREAYGFDKPIPVQYLIWLSRAVQGDFRNSLQSNRPVMDELILALRNTSCRPCWRWLDCSFGNLPPRG